MTLVEMLVVIALTAVLMGVAVPSMRAFLDRNRVADSVNSVVGSINFARGEAIKRGMRVVMCRSENVATAPNPTCASGSGDPSLGWASGWIVFTEFGTNDQYNPAAGDVLLRAQGSLAGNGSIVQNRNRKIVFAASGLATGTSVLQFTFHPPGGEGTSQERIVCVSMQGRPRLIKNTLAESCT